MAKRAERRAKLKALKRRVLDYYGGWMRRSKQANIARRRGSAANTPSVHKKMAWTCPCCGRGRPKHLDPIKDLMED